MRGSASVGISYTPRPSDHVSPLRIALFTGNYNHVEDGVSRTLGRLVGYLTGQGHEVLGRDADRVGAAPSGRLGPGGI